MGLKNIESQCRVIELDKYQRIRGQQREEEKQELISLVVTGEIYNTFKHINDKDFDYAIGHITDLIRDFGSLYEENPGRSAKVLKKSPDLYKSRMDITARLKAKAIAIFRFGK